MNEPYSKREEDAFRKFIKKELKEIKDQVRLTNGKVKKIIMVLIALAFYTLGVSGIGVPTIIQMFI